MRAIADAVPGMNNTYAEGADGKLAEPVAALGADSAAGALELVITVRALQDGVAPPTLNWLGADRDCIPDPVPNVARAVSTRAAMSNSFAFGGINASLVIRKV